MSTTRLLQILTWFVRRWRMEVTFEEARAHLGMETQRQWSDVAIARTTPVLLGLFSIVALMADRLIKQSHHTGSHGGLVHERAADLCRCDGARQGVVCGVSCHFSTSSQSRDVVKVPRSLLERLTDAVCYAA